MKGVTHEAAFGSGAPAVHLQASPPDPPLPDNPGGDPALGVGRWLLYGVLIGSGPIIFANGFTFVLVASILAMKRRYG